MLVDVLPRETPAAHAVLAGTVLIDTGGGTADNAERLERFLAGRPVELITLTHAHLDHAGGAAELRERLRAPVALHAADVATLARDATYLHQPLAPFTADRLLADGDVLPGGIEVVATPSQTPGHVAYWLPAARTVVTGDLLQRDDVAWLPPGADALDAAVASIERIAALGARRAIPGHGPEVTDVPAAVAATLARYAQWRAAPERQAWHGARRVAAGRLSLEHPRPGREAAVALVAAVPILADFAALAGFEARPFAAAVVEQLLGSGALSEGADGHLVTHFPHEHPG